MNIKGWISDDSSPDDYRLTAVIEKHLLEWLGRRAAAPPSRKITLPGWESALKVVINGHVFHGRLQVGLFLSSQHHIHDKCDFNKAQNLKNR